MSVGAGKAAPISGPRLNTPFFDLEQWRPALCCAATALLAAAPTAWGQQTPAPADQTTPPATDTASNITSYKPAFFEEFRPNTAFDMVTRIPGFSFDGGSFARGFSGTAGNVIIDGQRPPSRNDSLGSVLSRIPAAAVERIDVIRGGAEGIDMQGKSIIANVIRKPDAGLTGAISGGVNANSRGNGGGSAGIQMQDQHGGRVLEGALSVNGSNGSGENFRQRIAPSGIVILDASSQSESDFESAQLTGSYETALFGGKFRINGLARIQQNNFSSEEVQTIPLAGSQINQNENEFDNGELGVRYTRDIGGYSLELVAFQSLESSDFTGIFNTSNFTSGGKSTSDSGESIARATLRLPPADKFSIETGAEAVYNWTDTDSANILNGQVFPLPGDAFHADESRAEAFGTLTWKPDDKLNAEFGARYEWSRIAAEVGTDSSEKTLSYFKPRLNVSWTPIKDHQINLRIERLVDQLSFEGFASRASFENNVFGRGNADIEPEKSWIYEARYEHQFGGQNSFVGKLTHRVIDNVLGTVAGPAPDFIEFTVNGGEATYDSLDLSGNFELDKYGMPGGLINLGVNLRDSETTDPVTLESRRVSYDTPYGWNFSLQQTLDNGNFRWALFVEDDDDEYNYSVRSFGKQAQLMFIGGNITWKPAAGWTFGAGINNILKSGGRGWSVFYDAPRNIGTPLYLSRGHGDGAINYFMNLRKNF